ncbi:MAG: magnesium transporter CorA family protein, partial [Muribaculaceae bacterium]|nr:magnesium transporter CorA family protein [Muribaculaceae bacterium]
MITYLQSGNGYNEIDRWQPYCWVNVETPDNEEIAFLTGTLGIPEDFIGDVSDIDERPRVERNGEWILAILRIPVRTPEDGTPYRTVPMGVMICGETIISVCFYKNELTGDFIEHTRRRNIGVPSAADFTLRI